MTEVTMTTQQIINIGQVQTRLDATTRQAVMTEEAYHVVSLQHASSITYFIIDRNDAEVRLERTGSIQYSALNRLSTMTCIYTGTHATIYIDDRLATSC